MATTGIAERIAYGRPQSLEIEADEPIRNVPRASTALVGRILIAAIFIVSGIAKLTDIAGTAGYMTAVGIPNAPTLAVIAGLAELIGGLAIAFGFLGRLASLGLILVMVPTTLIFHGFWNFEGAEMKAQMVNFMKNLAIIGGLALLYAQGPGLYSVDRKMRRPFEP
jgi:putative oxidoreductase